MLEKLRNACVFPCFGRRVSWKVGSLKRRARSHMVRGEIKNCTTLWKLRVSEYFFEVPMSKNCTPPARPSSLSSTYYLFLRRFSFFSALLHLLSFSKGVCPRRYRPTWQHLMTRSGLKQPCREPICAGTPTLCSRFPICRLCWWCRLRCWLPAAT